MTDDTPYPEHTKLRAVQEQSQQLGDFLDWLPSELGIILCEADPNYTGDFSPYWPSRKRIEEILSTYFHVDLAALEAEKEAMLDALQPS